MVKRMYNRILRKIYTKLHAKFTRDLPDISSVNINTAKLQVIQYTRRILIDDNDAASLVAMKNGLGPLTVDGVPLDVQHIMSDYYDRFIMKLIDDDYIDRVAQVKILNDSQLNAPLFFEVKLLNVVEK